MKKINKIYLDYNSTALLDFNFDDIEPLIKTPLNPSSTHYYGRQAKKILETSRNNVKAILNIPEPSHDINLTFTSSGTEANNLVLKSFYNDNIFILSTEHSSIIEHKQYANNLKTIRVDENGIIDLYHLESLLNKLNNQKKILISVMLANNETGSIQPIHSICQIAQKFKAYVHSDCVQAIGKIPVNFNELGINSATISGHKIGSPAGIGALIYDNIIPLEAQIIGGGQEKNMRAGTENVLHAHLFGISANQALERLIEYQKHTQQLQQYLENQISAASNNQAKIWSQNCARLPNTSSIMMPNVDSRIQLIRFDMNGFAISNGAACSSGSMGEYSHVLKAMQIPKNEIKNTIRVSTGYATTKYEIDCFISSWEKIYNELSSME